MTDNEKPKKNKYPKREDLTIDIKRCTTCDKQCLGHGGGSSIMDGCFCNDGTYQECLI